MELTGEGNAAYIEASEPIHDEFRQQTGWIFSTRPTTSSARSSNAVSVIRRALSVMQRAMDVIEDAMISPIAMDTCVTFIRVIFRCLLNNSIVWAEEAVLDPIICTSFVGAR